jgi:hypothetical protein
LSTQPIRETPLVVVCNEVVDLQILVAPKLVPLTIPQIGIVEVTMIDIALHAFEVFRTLKVVLRDTHVIKKP